MKELMLARPTQRPFETNQISDLVADASTWTYDATLGWHRNIRDWNVPPIESSLSQDKLFQIKTISAVFSSYYDDPVNCLGSNVIYIHLDDGGLRRIGTSDAWADGPAGQNIHRGDQGDLSRAPINVNNERFTYTVPEGRYITKLTFWSAGLFDAVHGYPITRRGMKEFKLTFR